MKHQAIVIACLTLCLSACQPKDNSQTIQAASGNNASEINTFASEANTLQTIDIRSENIGQDFTLTDHNNQPFQLSQLKGKWVMLTFGFTNCPSICPTELYTYREATNQLDNQLAKNLAVVFVSIDPERDKPDIMKRYVQQFHPDFIGVTDTQNRIESVKKDWRIVALKSEIKSETIYNMDHTAGSYLIDKEGKTTHFIPFGISSTQLAQDLTNILTQ